MALMGRGGPGPYDCLTVVTPASLNPATIRHKGLKQRCYDSSKHGAAHARGTAGSLAGAFFWRCGLGFISLQATPLRTNLKRRQRLALRLSGPDRVTSCLLQTFFFFVLIFFFSLMPEKRAKTRIESIIKAKSRHVTRESPARPTVHYESSRERLITLARTSGRYGDVIFLILLELGYLPPIS